MNYLLGIIGEFQKKFSFVLESYYVEKIGEVSYDDSNAVNKTYRSLGDGGGFCAVMYYDGLFDRGGDNRFGMILGIGVKQGMLLLAQTRPERVFGFMTISSFD